MFDTTAYISYIITIIIGYITILVSSLFQAVDYKKKVKRKTNIILFVTTLVFIFMLIIVTFLYKGISILDVVTYISETFTFYTELLLSNYRFQFSYITESICAIISTFIFLVLLWRKSIFSREYLISIISAIVAIFFFMLCNFGFSYLIFTFVNIQFEILSIIINIIIYIFYTYVLVLLSNEINN